MIVDIFIARRQRDNFNFTLSIFSDSSHKLHQYRTAIIFHVFSCFIIINLNKYY